MTELDLDSNLIKLVLIADEFIENGDPLKDAMDDSEIEEVIQAVAEYYRNKYYLEEENEQ